MLSFFKKQNQLIEDESYFEALRAKEYAILDIQKHTYLDFTGGNLYSTTQLNKHTELLRNTVFGNPHSTNPTSKKATQLIDETRLKIISFFNAHDYECVFTQNASGALKIIGESFPFNSTSNFLLLSDNHNSVNGIREFCKSKGGVTKYIPVNFEDLEVNGTLLEKEILSAPQSSSNLFAFPAQSNVSGVKHDLKWIDFAQKNGFYVLLDAAAFVPTSRLDLSVVKPDFVSMSFYKIFGFPTGIGCLLIKKSSFNLLTKPWFAGGTVDIVTVGSQNNFLTKGHERFEDGTLNYANIPAIKIGLDYIESIGVDRISKRIQALTKYLIDELLILKHDNGQNVVKIFGPSNLVNRGGNVIMNFFDVNGTAFQFEKIEEIANSKNISIRSGCFCNPGIDEINNCLSTEELSNYFTSRNDGNYYDMISFLGKMRGATRISVGIATSQKDIDTFIGLIKSLKNKDVKQF